MDRYWWVAHCKLIYFITNETFFFTTKIQSIQCFCLVIYKFSLKFRGKNVLIRGEHGFYRPNQTECLFFFFIRFQITGAVKILHQKFNGTLPNDLERQVNNAWNSNVWVFFLSYCLSGGNVFHQQFTSSICTWTQRILQIGQWRFLFGNFMIDLSIANVII